IDPRVPDFHFNLATVLRSMQRLPEAASAYANAIALKPEHADAHFELGNLHARIDADRLLDELDRLLVAAGLVRQHAQQMQRRDVARLGREQVAIKHFRLGQRTGLVMAKCRAQHGGRLWTCRLAQFCRGPALLAIHAAPLKNA
ncbi:MAG: tetratricopeptide repeat protein, partial [Pseudorhodoplanes sp.]|nr:tetratricopeptide repeat protein [Pseudorhodoplanes sp.]